MRAVGTFLASEQKFVAPYIPSIGRGGSHVLAANSMICTVDSGTERMQDPRLLLKRGRVLLL